MRVKECRLLRTMRSLKAVDLFQGAKVNVDEIADRTLAESLDTEDIE